MTDDALRSLRDGMNSPSRRVPVITDLGDDPGRLSELARWHYDQWGALTGAESLDGYAARLAQAAASRAVPSVLVAVLHGDLLGSVSLVACDLPCRPALTPWLAQLFVAPAHRGAGVGAALVQGALARAGQCGHRRVYLYTSGTLPGYYGRLGWRVVERLEFLERQRTVMVYDLGPYRPVDTFTRVVTSVATATVL